MTDDSVRNVGPAALARELLAAVVESSDDVIVSKTLEGIITSWNPAAERTFGWTASEAIGQHITLIVPDDRRVEEDDVLARIRRGERVDHFETVRRTKAGRLVAVSITVSPVRDATGRIVGASKVARDITDRRRLEEARTRLLEREQEARNRAEALNSAKDELLATVSHELRTPLNAIFGWARMIQSGDLDDAGRMRALNAILRNAAAQARLIEDLIDLSRIASGRIRLELQPMDLNATIEAAIDTVRPAAGAKSVTLNVALDQTLRTIDGAPDRLQQVIWNLLMNAVKFSPPGSHVTVSSRREEARAVIAVTDDGEGIGADVLPHIFDAFRQEDSSSTRTQGGLGLGLTLVRRIVEAHGGTVIGESPGKGRGATFTVSLPVPPTRPDPPQRESQAPTDRTTRPDILVGARVLVVDDDPEFLELSTMILRRAGAEVRTAASAALAYEIVASWLPDVLLTDLAMPGEDGYMLASGVRSVFSDRRAPVSIIAVTAYGTQESRTRAILAGFDLYLTKPVEPLDLAGAVAEVIRRQA